MKKRLVSLLLAVTLLSGCGAGSPKAVPKASKTLEAAALSDGLEEDATAACADFAAELLRQSRAEGENTLLSPLSVYLALGMTAGGACGDTRAEFEAVLGLEQDDLDAFCSQMVDDYRELEGSTESTLVNSLWCDPDLELKEDFVARCQQFYDAALFHADLQSPDTLKALNRWVSDATDGRIPQAMEELDDQAVLELVSALCLKNRFEYPFRTPSVERQMDFTAENGQVTHPREMQNGTRHELYLSHDGGCGVVLPYDDGRLGLMLMLPDEGSTLTSYLSGWDGTTIRSLLNGAEDRVVSLTVPSFTMEWDGRLDMPLQAMGLKQAFDDETADFTAMGTADGLIYIGRVIHQTAFDLNEKGTEAAAVTVVEMVTSTVAIWKDEPIVLCYDRPFVYGIVDLTTGLPLFLGTAERLT